nr:MAG TPA: hypothetical protein [Bacteriophage sp.]
MSGFVNCFLVHFFFRVRRSAASSASICSKA